MYDLIIIGCGPSGISMGLHNKYNKILIIEKGKDLFDRNINIPEDVVNGFGGAGLFSDGKISFPPSSSSFWKYSDKSIIKKSYKIVQDWFKECNLFIYDWNDSWLKEEFYNYTNNKSYKSILITKEEALNFLNYARKKLEGKIIYNTEVIKILKNNNYYEIHCSNNDVFKTKQVVISTGKYSFDLSSKSNIQSCLINKVELGIRIEMPSDLFIPYNLPEKDFKYIEKINDDTEFRTFCCCKDGTVIKSKTNNIFSYNGLDVKREEKMSNIGLLISNSNEKSNIYKDILKCISKSYKEYEPIPLLDYINDGILINDEVDKILKKKISDICDINNGDGIKKAKVYYYEVEKIGPYPKINLETCKIEPEDIWYIGDATGKFRGLLSSILSGVYTSISMGLYDKIYFKKSDTSRTKLIFTALSKKFFFCKDSICEYVFQKKCIPFNPFKSFGYFLNDKVSRDLIRRANNEMLNRADELWVFGPISDGVLFEIKYAKSLGKKIEYFSISSYSNQIYPIKYEDIVFEPEVFSKRNTKEDLMNFIVDNNISNYYQLSFFNEDEES